MIRYNKDKFLAEIVGPINNLPILKGLSNPRDIWVYGINREKPIDVAIPEDFPKDVDNLTALFNKYGFVYSLDNFWDMSEDHGYATIGLGFKVRSTNKEACRKMILTSYLLLNDVTE